MSPFQALLALGFVIACAYTVFGYPSRYGALSPRSRLFRTLGLFLLNLLLGLVLLGTALPFEEGPGNRAAALRQFAYWLACLFLALSLMCVALLDWLESMAAYQRARRDILYKMAQEERERKEGEQKDKDASGPPA